GSTVRVRQRALQKCRTWPFFFRIDLQVVQIAVGMEPFLEPSESKRSDPAAKNASEMIVLASRPRQSRHPGQSGDRSFSPYPATRPRTELTVFTAAGRWWDRQPP